jgi:hypothetical protein
MASTSPKSDKLVVVCAGGDEVETGGTPLTTGRFSFLFFFSSFFLFSFLSFFFSFFSLSRADRSNASIGVDVVKGFKYVLNKDRKIELPKVSPSLPRSLR